MIKLLNWLELQTGFPDTSALLANAGAPREVGDGPVSTGTSIQQLTSDRGEGAARRAGQAGRPIRDPGNRARRAVQSGTPDPGQPAELGSCGSLAVPAP